MPGTIMIQGTMSNVGKSLLVAGLCRILRQDGYSVAPFKSQNMALNSFITKDGLEIGRAQAMQAEAAGILPSVFMNPILLKPTSDMGSQVIVNGEVCTTMPAKEYFQFKTKLIPDILRSFSQLKKQYDFVIIEGAGSPAEINLKQNDIVNMGMAELADAPVLLAGDIDRGGVFAQLYGTVMLLEEKERERIKGIIINKFRGDKTILKPGLKMLEDKVSIPVVGVIPYINLDIDDEDSLTERFQQKKKNGRINIVVIRFPRISNFTDLAPLESCDDINLTYVTTLKQFITADKIDMVILPGTKNTIEDLLWMRQSGLESAVIKLSEKQIPIFGICGGYQMMGEELFDPNGTEGEKAGVCLRGMGLLPVKTVFCREKTRTLVKGKFLSVEGIFSGLKGCSYEGYEIHMGKTIQIENKDRKSTISPHGISAGNYYGTYIHGIFDCAEVCQEILKALLKKKGLLEKNIVFLDRRNYKEEQYNKLADEMRENLDMKMIYQLLK